MNVQIERYDESCPPDENGVIHCPHTGITYTFWEKDQKLIFRRDDSDPKIAALTHPEGWYVDLFDTTLYRAAADYLCRIEGVLELKAYSQMNGATIALPLPDERNDSRSA